MNTCCKQCKHEWTHPHDKDYIVTCANPSCECHQAPTDWEKEFDKKFVENKREGGPIYTAELRDDHIKTFIGLVLQSERLAIIQELEGIINDAEKMKKEEGYEDVGIAIGAVKALTDAISKIKERLCHE